MRTGGITLLFVYLIAIAMAIGWLINVVKFIRCDFEPSYKAEIIRGIGIIAPPIGGIVGYLNFGK